MDLDDASLFASLQQAERSALVPAKTATLSETMMASSDPRMQALASHAASTTNDEADVPFLLSLLSSGDAAVLEASGAS